jgi:hypothetical protein
MYQITVKWRCKAKHYDRSLNIQYMTRSINYLPGLRFTKDVTILPKSFRQSVPLWRCLLNNYCEDFENKAKTTDSADSCSYWVGVRCEIDKVVQQLGRPISPAGDQKIRNVSVHPLASIHAWRVEASFGSYVSLMLRWAQRDATVTSCWCMMCGRQVDHQCSHRLDRLSTWYP